MTYLEKSLLSYIKKEIISQHKYHSESNRNCLNEHLK